MPHKCQDIVILLYEKKTVVVFLLRLKDKYMVRETKYKVNIKLAVGMCLLFITGLIFISKDRLNRETIMESMDDRSDLIVLFNEAPDEQELSMILEAYNQNVKLVEHFEDYALISVSNSQVLEEVMAYLLNHPLVRIVEPNGQIELMQTTNDTYSSAQWAINNPGNYSVYYDDQIRVLQSTEDVDMNISEAWMDMYQEEIDFRKVIVAIIDTGVDYTHPDLKGQIWENKNEIPGDGIDNDNNGFVDDIYGWDFYNDDSSVCHYKYDKKADVNLALPEDNDDHGTHIAGIIAAVSDNEVGIAGIGSNIDIELMILKVNGGPEGTGSISDAILAIKYATMMGADICNISWGTSQYSYALQEVIRESDMLFVAAAGNLGSDNDNKPVYPASYDLENLISTTFIDANGRLTRLSNYGKVSVDIAAPGSDIISTVVGSYNTYSGSSMAAPHVSGVASLIYSYKEGLYPSAVKDLIINTLKPLSSLEGKVLYPGIPNANKALSEIPQIKTDLLYPIIELDTIYNSREFIVPINIVDQGGSGIRTVRWLAGKRKLEDFNRGTSGFEVKDRQIKVSRAGIYTIYTSDYAGNESIKHYEVTEDISPPTISANYKISKDYKKRTISIKVQDSQSGIRRVKYLSGKKEFSDFLPAGSGTEIKLDKARGSFSVKKDGIYSIYAIDNRGNQVVKQIEVKTIKADEIKFTRSHKSMKIGESYYLRAFVKPANTTDVISYTSSNKGVAIVDNRGEIIALSEGTAIITARTNSGQEVSCRIKVDK